MANSNSLSLLDRRFNDFKGTLPDNLDIGEQFEFFCADIVHKDQNWSIDELQSGMIGGGKDGGMDAFFLRVNGELIIDVDDLPDIKSGIQIQLTIMQMKHEAATKEAVINCLHQHIEQALALSPDNDFHNKHFNKSTQAKLELFRATMNKYGVKQYTLRIELQYCSRGLAPVENTLSLAKKLENKCLESFPSSEVSFQFFGAEKLHSIAARPRQSSRPLKVRNGTISTDPGPSHLCLVSLSDYVDFISNDDKLDQKLFEFNVRDFEGMGRAVNKSIAETLQSPTAETDFWWLNNGITIISDAVTVTNKTLTIDNPMIVNGLQTSNMIFENREYYDNDDERSILVRVVQTNDSSIQESVIQATNSQNTLSPLALKATEKQQKDIEEYLVNYGFFYERRKNFYKNRDKPSNSIISLQKLAQAVMAIKIGVPEQARARPGSFLNNKTNYKSVFPPNTNFDGYVNAAKLERLVEGYLQVNRKTIDPLYRNNLKYHSMMVLGWNITGSTNPVLATIDISKASNGEINKAFNFVKAAFDNSGAEDKTAKDSDFTLKLKELWNLGK